MRGPINPAQRKIGPIYWAPTPEIHARALRIMTIPIPAEPTRAKLVDAAARARAASDGRARGPLRAPCHRRSRRCAGIARGANCMRARSSPMPITIRSGPCRWRCMPADAAARGLARLEASDRLIGLMPVRSALARAVDPRADAGRLERLSPHSPFRHSIAIEAMQAAGDLLDAARKSGARALLLPALRSDGAAFAALEQALSATRPVCRHRCEAIAAPRSIAREMRMRRLRDALGAKKLKELRRQRHRLEDTGRCHLRCGIVRRSRSVAALEAFLALEAKRLEGRARHRLDAACRAMRPLSAKPHPRSLRAAQFEIVSLTRNGATLASGLILRDARPRLFLQDRDGRKRGPHLAGRPAHARPHAPSVRRSRHRLRRFIDRQRASDDRSYLARAHRDRRRVHCPVAARPASPPAIRVLVKARIRAIDLVRAIQTDQGETVMTFFEPTDTDRADARPSRTCRSRLTPSFRRQSAADAAEARRAGARIAARPHRI